MRNVFLIAFREYADNAKTKGFWFGLLFIPVLIYGMIEIPMLLERKATPTRYFTLVDQSGQFEAAIDRSLDRAHQRKIREAFQQYTARHAGTNVWGKLDLEKLPAPNRRSENLPEWLSELEIQDGPVNPDGAMKYMMAQVKPFLKPGAPEFEEPRRDFQRVPLPNSLPPESDFDTLINELRSYLRRKEKIEVNGEQAPLFAAVLIPADAEKKARSEASPTGTGREAGIQYWSANLAETSLRDLVERSVNNEIRRREVRERGVDVRAIAQVLRVHVPVIDLDPKKEEGKEQVSLADRVRQWAPAGFVYLLWLSIFTIIQTLLNNTIEEKSNRLIEVLLSSVTPGQLMMGKLAGIMCVGLTITGTWVVTLIGILAWKSGPESELASQLLGVVQSSNLLLAFIVYFLVGFLMYAGMILALGSVCNTIKEAANFMGLIVMVMMVPLLTMMFIPRDPNGPLATFLSWVPIYTPFVMLNRAAADPPLFDVVGTFLLMAATTVLVLWASAKIFRIGILRTGQPPKLLELLRWLKA